MDPRPVEFEMLGFVQVRPGLVSWIQPATAAPKALYTIAQLLPPSSSTMQKLPPWVDALPPTSGVLPKLSILSGAPRRAVAER
jgi:hypothetical protein